MKRLGLTPLLAAATLFLGGSAGAEEAKPAPSALNLPPASVSPESGQDHAKEMTDSLVGTGDSKLDEQAYTEMLREQAARQTKAATAPGPVAPELYRQKMLERFDKNGDGVLDEAERAEARKFAAEHGPGFSPAELVQRFDRDGDGKLNVDEVAGLMAFLREMRAPNVSSISPATKAEAERLERVAAEVARRRALREQAAKVMEPKPGSKP
ncbi:MAG: EF-hand domain-containing protein [Verrucomicrobia bacterium]|nr:EF-hand domain-containing protein [Verrucomicrobiota bacterium]